jgi:tetratricopeptide (TPR) repeat protein
MFRSAGTWILAGSVLLAASPVLAGKQNSPRVAMLEQDGWAAIKDGKPAAAADLFREAITLDPKNASLRLGAATAAFQQRRDAEAKAYAEQALALEPRSAMARVLLAQVSRRQGDLAEAIRLYEMVAADVPGDDAVRETLDRWKRERDLHDRMLTTVGNFFTVQFEGAADAAMAAQALESLNKAYWRITDVFGVIPQRSIPVVLYSGAQFEDITRSPKWAAAAFDGIIRVPMAGANEQGEDLDRVLAHEFTHALIRSLATRGLPAWLNEGLASVLERDSLDWAAQRIANVEAPTLAMLTAPFGKLSGAEAQIAYAASALAARRLLDEAGGPAIANLLRDLGDGVAFEDAFAHRVQKSLADFEATLKK